MDEKFREILTEKREKLINEIKEELSKKDENGNDKIKYRHQAAKVIMEQLKRIGYSDDDAKKFFEDFLENDNDFNKLDVIPDDLIFAEKESLIENLNKQKIEKNISEKEYWEEYNKIMMKLGVGKMSTGNTSKGGAAWQLIHAQLRDLEKKKNKNMKQSQSFDLPPKTPEQEEALEKRVKELRKEILEAERQDNETEVLKLEEELHNLEVSSKKEKVSKKTQEDIKSSLEEMSEEYIKSNLKKVIDILRDNGWNKGNILKWKEKGMPALTKNEKGRYEYNIKQKKMENKEEGVEEKAIEASAEFVKKLKSLSNDELKELHSYYGVLANQEGNIENLKKDSRYTNEEFQEKLEDFYKRNNIEIYKINKKDNGINHLNVHRIRGGYLYMIEKEIMSREDFHKKTTDGEDEAWEIFGNNESFDGEDNNERKEKHGGLFDLNSINIDKFKEKKNTEGKENGGDEILQILESNEVPGELQYSVSKISDLVGTFKNAEKNEHNYDQTKNSVDEYREKVVEISKEKLINTREKRAESKIKLDGQKLKIKNISDDISKNDEKISIYKKYQDYAETEFVLADDKKEVTDKDIFGNITWPLEDRFLDENLKYEFSEINDFKNNLNEILRKRGENNTPKNFSEKMSPEEAKNALSSKEAREKYLSQLEEDTDSALKKRRIKNEEQYILEIGHYVKQINAVKESIGDDIEEALRTKEVEKNKLEFSLSKEEEIYSEIEAEYNNKDEEVKLYEAYIEEYDREDWFEKEVGSKENYLKKEEVVEKSEEKEGDSSKKSNDDTRKDPASKPASVSEDASENKKDAPVQILEDSEKMPNGDIVEVSPENKGLSGSELEILRLEKEIESRKDAIEVLKSNKPENEAERVEKARALVKNIAAGVELGTQKKDEEVKGGWGKLWDKFKSFRLVKEWSEMSKARKLWWSFALGTTGVAAATISGMPVLTGALFGKVMLSAGGSRMTTMIGALAGGGLSGKLSSSLLKESKNKDWKVLGFTILGGILGGGLARGVVDSINTIDNQNIPEKVETAKAEVKMETAKAEIHLTPEQIMASELNNGLEKVGKIPSVKFSWRSMQHLLENNFGDNFSAAERENIIANLEKIQGHKLDGQMISGEQLEKWFREDISVKRDGVHQHFGGVLEAAKGLSNQLETNIDTNFTHTGEITPQMNLDDLGGKQDMINRVVEADNQTSQVKGSEALNQTEITEKGKLLLEKERLEQIKDSMEASADNLIQENETFKEQVKELAQMRTDSGEVDKTISDIGKSLSEKEIRMQELQLEKEKMILENQMKHPVDINNSSSAEIMHQDSLDSLFSKNESVKIGNLELSLSDEGVVDQDNNVVVKKPGFLARLFGKSLEKDTLTFIQNNTDRIA